MKSLIVCLAAVSVLAMSVFVAISLLPPPYNHLELVGKRPGNLEEEIFTLRWLGGDKDLNVTDYLPMETREWVQEVRNGDTFDVVITEPVSFSRPLQPDRMSGSWVVIRWDDTTATLIRNGTIYTNQSPEK